MSNDPNATSGPLRPSERPVMDEPGPLAAGAELPVLKLAQYLEGRLEGVHGTLVVEQFSKGYSNLTYLLRAGEREYVLRRPPAGVAIKSAHDMGREFRILSKLAAVYDKVPKPHLFCEDESILGVPFYVMERVRGTILRSKVRAGAELAPERMAILSTATVDALAEIHRLDVQAAGLGDLGKPEGYAERQVRGWTERYEKSKTKDVPAMDAVARWLADHRPPSVTSPARAALLHNDFKYDNVVLEPGTLHRVVAVLDWEMATVGDPVLDLGTALGYWVQADDPPALKAMAFGPTHLPGNLTRREVVARYQEKVGTALAEDAVHYAFVYAFFKLGVVAAQLYRRYVSGLTHEARYASMFDGMGAVAQAAQIAIARGRIDGLEER